MVDAGVVFPKGEVTVRPATVEDQGPIHALHARCLGDAFVGLLGGYVPASEQRGRHERSWTGPIGSPHPRHALLVAERFQRVVGFVAVGPTRDADGDRQTTGELRAAMVDDWARGIGVGSALVAAGEQAMRESGFSVATLWVIPANTRAVRCYERLGWGADGTEKLDELGGREIQAVRYRKRLTA